MRSAAHKGRVLMLAGCAAAALAGAAALRADLMVAHGFKQALGAHNGKSSLDLVSQGRRLQAEVGDEGYWLTRADVASTTSFSKPLTIGDRITISDRNGRERRLQVVDVKSIGVPLFRTAAGAPTARLVQVICRDIDAPERDREAMVRFIIESDMAEPATMPPQAPQPVSPKAL
jgi:hypothetical protein